jgi:hypothetical protein
MLSRLSERRVLLGRRVPLLLNERDEWMPGGRLETGEQPE